jgi:hypothetical protein
METYQWLISYQKSLREENIFMTIKLNKQTR